MKPATRGTFLFAAGLALTAALPFAGRAIRGPRPPRCLLDGVALAGAPVVRLFEEDGTGRAFCCVGCAEAWIRGTGRPPARVTVTDGTTGATVDAAGATFVRSTVPAQPATGDRVHAFREIGDAIRHAEAYRGRLLSGKERPFGGK